MSQNTETAEYLKKPSEKPKDTFRIDSLDMFLQHARKLLRDIDGKHPEGKKILAQVEEKIATIQEKYQDLSDEKSDLFRKLSKQIGDEFLKFDNRYALAKLLGKEEITDDSARHFQLTYQQKKIDVTINDSYQINLIAVEGRFIQMKHALDVEHFPMLLHNFQKFLKEHTFSKDKMYSPDMRFMRGRISSGDTHFVADGTMRFSYEQDGKELMCVVEPYGQNFVKFFEVHEQTTPNEEAEITVLEQKIQDMSDKIQKILVEEKRAGRRVFQLEDALMSPVSMFPEKFQPDLATLQKYSLQLDILKKKAETTVLYDRENVVQTPHTMKNQGHDHFTLTHNVPTGSEDDFIRIEQEYTLLGNLLRDRSSSSGSKNIEETVYEPLGNGKIKAVSSVIIKPDEQQSLCTEKEADCIRVMSEILFDDDGKPLEQTYYRYKEKKISYVTKISDGSTQKIFYTPDTQRPFFSKKNIGQPGNIFAYGKDGKKYTDFESARIKDPKLQQQDYLRRLEKVFGEDEAFDLFLGQYVRYSFFDKNGTEFQDYISERKKSGLSPDQYLAQLATTFDSPFAWNAFITKFMRYVPDSMNFARPLEIGTQEKHGNYVQTWIETLYRVDETGKSLGDCDDYAFLIQAILQKQGITKAAVIHIPGHALCAWIKKRPDGKYDAYSICTYGYDKNGNRYQRNNSEDFNPKKDFDPKK